MCVSAPSYEQAVKIERKGSELLVVISFASQACDRNVVNLGVCQRGCTQEKIENQQPVTSEEGTSFPHYTTPHLRRRSHCDRVSSNIIKIQSACSTGPWSHGQ